VGRPRDSGDGRILFLAAGVGESGTAGRIDTAREIFCPSGIVGRGGAFSRGRVPTAGERSIRARPARHRGGGPMKYLLMIYDDETLVIHEGRGVTVRARARVFATGALATSSRPAASSPDAACSIRYARKALPRSVSEVPGSNSEGITWAANKLQNHMKEARQPCRHASSEQCL